MAARSCGRGRRYGAATCDAPNLPADVLEQLVTDALLETYQDTGIFEQAIQLHGARRADAETGLQQQRDAAIATLAAKLRIHQRYQEDYATSRPPRTSPG